MGEKRTESIIEELVKESYNYKGSLEDRKKAIKKRIDNRNKSKQKLYSFAGLIIGMTILISIAFAALGFPAVQNIMIACLGVIYGGLIVFLTALKSTSIEENELLDIENEIELTSLDNYSDAQRSEKLFKNHHSELKRYYDENLNQSRMIFRIGIGCILAGFIIVLLTIYMVWQNLNNELSNKLIIGGLGAITAVLTNFVGVMYLKMHTETTRSLTQFHNRFVNTHHFHFGNFLISKIEDPIRREEALANLALSINQTANLEEVNNEPNQGTQ